MPLPLFPTHSPLRMTLTILALLAMAYAVFVEPLMVMVTRLSVGDGTSVIRIAQLSDIHIRTFGWREQRVVARLNEIKPDLLVLTGDVMANENSLALMETFLAALPPISHKLAVQGNWEHYETTEGSLRQMYQRQGVTLLNNESVVLNFGDRSLLVTGLDDNMDGSADLSVALRHATPADNHLILIHSPEYFDLLLPLLAQLNQSRGDGSLFRPALALAGHTHGGQVTFFGKAIKTAPGSGPYVSGWYGQEGGMRLYVSRGIGISLAPVRFFAPPEIPVFEWGLR